VVYREEPHRVGFYDYHRWAVNPRTALTRVLADRIRAASLFESVTVAGSPARAAYLLRGEIERLEEIDEETSVHAICAISAEVVDANPEPQPGEARPRRRCRCTSRTWRPSWSPWAWRHGP
jgi:hypothetical protein